MGNPKCSVCGKEASHMVANIGFMCNDCYGTNPLVSNLTERNKKEKAK
jgi:NMD protein affecting ribosome stability and mRNA decay